MLLESVQSTFFSLPFGFSQFIIIKLASDAQINMYTASFI